MLAGSYRDDNNIGITVGGIMTVLMASNTIWMGIVAARDFSEVNKCREAKEAYVEWGVGDSETRRRIEEEWLEKYE
jgi:hypothetical protein